jgi:hypothetical protein
MSEPDATLVELQAWLIKEHGMKGQRWLSLETRWSNHSSNRGLHATGMRKLHRKLRLSPRILKML